MGEAVERPEHRKYGRIMRYRELGRALGVSHHSVEHRISALVSAGVLRRLDPLQLDTIKRLVKSPKIYSTFMVE